MLSEYDKSNVFELLSIVPQDDLIALSRATTSGLLTTDNKDGAISTILQHAEDVRSVLGRKKLTRNVLFKYLHDSGVQIPASIDKAGLIEATLRFWDNRSSIQLCDSDSITNLSVINQLSVKFTEWYFKKLNNGLMNFENGLKVEDFWPDANASIRLVSQDQTQVLTAQTGTEILNLIRSLQLEHNIFFSPNLSDRGIKGREEPHGLVAVMVCGTLHKLNECVGVFEQIFGLVKDPYTQNNWKMKTTNLVLRNQQGVTSYPELPG